MTRSARFVWLGLCGWAAAAPAPGQDAVFAAMEQEIARSMARLRLEEQPAPYYIAYTIRETDELDVAASFGALAKRGRWRTRELDADVRVGDYELDSSNFGGGGGFPFAAFMHFGGSTPLPLDDDVDALRHVLWQATDAAYKAAIEQLEAKKAWLQQHTVVDRPADFSREEPVVAVGPAAVLEVDEPRQVELAVRLSALFRDFPRIQKSVVMFSASGVTRWLQNSEGFRSREGWTRAAFVVLATAQADDGMRVADGIVFAGRSASDLPQAEALEAEVRAFAQRLTALAEAPLVESYRGPILLEGQAAAEFVCQVLVPHLGNAHEPLGEDGPLAFGNQLKRKLGRRVMSPFLTVVDDPTAREHGGVPLLGSYAIDDDGIAAQKVTLIENGVLKAFCMSRIPTREIAQSNGHSERGVGTPSTLFVRASETMSLDALRQRLRQLGEEEDLDHVLIARRIGNFLTSALNPRSLAMSFMGMTGGGAVLQAPVLLYRVSLEDGSETLVRGARFGTVTLRALRDIEAAGDDARAHLAFQDPSRLSQLVVPSLLLEEIEIHEPVKETEKPPALAHPFFAK